MRKNFLIYQIIFSFFILSFPSCINQDFDLDDDKLDTNVTLGSGIDLPVGDIEKISIYDELLKVYDSLKVGDDGVLYVEYAEAFPVEFPEFKVPQILPVDIVSSLPFSGENLPLSLWEGDELHLVDGEIKDVITKPKLDDNDFVFAPIEIGFGSLTLKVGFKLSGIVLKPEDNNAEVVITLTIPEAYSLEKGSKTIEKQFSFKEISDGNYKSLGEIKVKSYTFGNNGNLTYRAVLKKGNATLLTAAAPIFNFKIEAESPNPPEISYLKCRISGEKSFPGEENRFDDLRGAFSDDDTLEFKDPSFKLGLATNLDAKFNLGINLSRNDGISDSCVLEKSGRSDTSYILTTKELVNFAKIISTPFPEKLNYDVKLIFDADQEVVLPGSPDVSANYSFKIPFEFDKISLSLKDTITDLFNEDTYEQIFSHIGDVAIEADLDINIGNGDIELEIEAVVLNSTFAIIPDLVDVSRNNNILSIAIKNDEDGEKMKTARHLAFTFRLSGGDAIKESDYIEIKNVKLVSGSGIHYEF